MNYMEQVAELLGVELGEKFKINFHGDISNDEYYIDENSIHEVCDGKVNDYCYPLLIALLNGTDTVVKLPKNILTEKEKEYLSSIISPFRNRVEHISKYDYRSEYGSGYEYIKIKYNEIYDTHPTFSLILPCFEKGTMYTGMIEGRAYSLSELSL